MGKEPPKSETYCIAIGDNKQETKIKIKLLYLIKEHEDSRNSKTIKYQTDYLRKNNLNKTDSVFPLFYSLQHAPTAQGYSCCVRWRMHLIPIWRSFILFKNVSALSNVFFLFLFLSLVSVSSFAFANLMI